MNADGTNVAKLTADIFFHYDYGPAWSPDGAKLAFTRSDNCVDLGIGTLFCFDSTIFVMDSGGSNQTFLTGGNIFANAAANPTWSPYGTKIAFEGIAAAPFATDLFFISINGGVWTNLSNTTEAAELDPDWGPARVPSAIDDAQFFVTQHYCDFLNREPDPDGLAFWTNEITSCGSDAGCIEARRINVSAAFFLSIEFQQTGYLVYRIYQASYGNLTGLPVPIRLTEFLPDTRELGQNVIVNQPGWEQVLENNKQTFASEFVQRSSFVAALPTSMTPTEFVDKLLTNANLTPAAAERADAINEFGSAPTSADLTARVPALRRVAENQTLMQQEFNRAFVLMQYFGYLRRDPDDAPDNNFGGYDFWLAKLDQFNGNYIDAEMVKAFIVSGEYRRRFGQP